MSLKLRASILVSLSVGLITGFWLFGTEYQYIPHHSNLDILVIPMLAAMCTAALYYFFFPKSGIPLGALSPAKQLEKGVPYELKFMEKLEDGTYFHVVYKRVTVAGSKRQPYPVSCKFTLPSKFILDNRGEIYPIP